jgi:hypothetical protein
VSNAEVVGQLAAFATDEQLSDRLLPQVKLKPASMPLSVNEGKLLVSLEVDVRPAFSVAPSFHPDEISG